MASSYREVSARAISTTASHPDGVGYNPGDPSASQPPPTQRSSSQYMRQAQESLAQQHDREIPTTTRPPADDAAHGEYHDSDARNLHHRPSPINSGASFVAPPPAAASSHNQPLYATASAYQPNGSPSPEPTMVVGSAGGPSSAMYPPSLIEAGDAFGRSFSDTFASMTPLGLPVNASSAAGRRGATGVGSPLRRGGQQQQQDQQPLTRAVPPASAYAAGIATSRSGAPPPSASVGKGYRATSTAAVDERPTPSQPQSLPNPTAIGLPPLSPTRLTRDVTRNQPYYHSASTPQPQQQQPIAESLPSGVLWRPAVGSSNNSQYPSITRTDSGVGPTVWRSSGAPPLPAWGQHDSYYGDNNGNKGASVSAAGGGRLAVGNNRNNNDPNAESYMPQILTDRIERRPDGALPSEELHQCLVLLWVPTTLNKSRKLDPHFVPWKEGKWRVRKLILRITNTMRQERTHNEKDGRTITRERLVRTGELSIRKYDEKQTLRFCEKVHHLSSVACFAVPAQFPVPLLSATEGDEEVLPKGKQHHTLPQSDSDDEEGEGGVRSTSAAVVPNDRSTVRSNDTNNTSSSNTKIPLPRKTSSNFNFLTHNQSVVWPLSVGGIDAIQHVAGLSSRERAEVRRLRGDRKRVRYTCGDVGFRVVGANGDVYPMALPNSVEVEVWLETLRDMMRRHEHDAAFDDDGGGGSSSTRFSGATVRETLQDAAASLMGGGSVSEAAANVYNVAAERHFQHLSNSATAANNKSGLGVAASPSSSRAAPSSAYNNNPNNFLGMTDKERMIAKISYTEAHRPDPSGFVMAFLARDIRRSKGGVIKSSTTIDNPPNGGEVLLVKEDGVTTNNWRLGAKTIAKSGLISACRLSKSALGKPFDKVREAAGVLSMHDIDADDCDIYVEFPWASTIIVMTSRTKGQALYLECKTLDNRIAWENWLRLMGAKKILSLEEQAAIIDDTKSVRSAWRGFDDEDYTDSQSMQTQTLRPDSFAAVGRFKQAPNGRSARNYSNPYDEAYYDQFGEYEEDTMLMMNNRGGGGGGGWGDDGMGGGSPVGNGSDDEAADFVQDGDDVYLRNPSLGGPFTADIISKFRKANATIPRGRLSITAIRSPLSAAALLNISYGDGDDDHTLGRRRMQRFHDGDNDDVSDRTDDAGDGRTPLSQRSNLTAEAADDSGQWDGEQNADNPQATSPLSPIGARQRTLTDAEEDTLANKDATMARIGAGTSTEAAIATTAAQEERQVRQLTSPFSDRQIGRILGSGFGSPNNEDDDDNDDAVNSTLRAVKLDYNSINLERAFARKVEALVTDETLARDAMLLIEHKGYRQMARMAKMMWEGIIDRSVAGGGGTSGADGAAASLSPAHRSVNRNRRDGLQSPACDDGFSPASAGGGANTPNLPLRGPQLYDDEGVDDDDNVFSSPNDVLIDEELIADAHKWRAYVAAASASPSRELFSPPRDGVEKQQQGPMSPNSHGAANSGNTTDGNNRSVRFNAPPASPTSPRKASSPNGLGYTKGSSMNGNESGLRKPRLNAPPMETLDDILIRSDDAAHNDSEAGGEHPIPLVDDPSASPYQRRMRLKNLEAHTNRPPPTYHDASAAPTGSAANMSNAMGTSTIAGASMLSASAAPNDASAYSDAVNDRSSLYAERLATLPPSASSLPQGGPYYNADSMIALTTAVSEAERKEAIRRTIRARQAQLALHMSQLAENRVGKNGAEGAADAEEKKRAADLQEVMDEATRHSITKTAPDVLSPEERRFLALEQQAVHEENQRTAGTTRVMANLNDLANEASMVALRSAQTRDAMINAPIKPLSQEQIALLRAQLKGNMAARVKAAADAHAAGGADDSDPFADAVLGNAGKYSRSEFPSTINESIFAGGDNTDTYGDVDEDDLPPPPPAGPPPASSIHTAVNYDTAFGRSAQIVLPVVDEADHKAGGKAKGGGGADQTTTNNQRLLEVSRAIAATTLQCPRRGSTADAGDNVATLNETMKQHYSGIMSTKIGGGDGGQGASSKKDAILPMGQLDRVPIVYTDGGIVHHIASPPRKDPLRSDDSDVYGGKTPHTWTTFSVERRRSDAAPHHHPGGLLPPIASPSAAAGGASAVTTNNLLTKDLLAMPSSGLVNSAYEFSYGFNGFGKPNTSAIVVGVDGEVVDTSDEGTVQQRAHNVTSDGAEAAPSGQHLSFAASLPPIAQQSTTRRAPLTSADEAWVPHTTTSYRKQHQQMHELEDDDRLTHVLAAANTRSRAMGDHSAIVAANATGIPSATFGAANAVCAICGNDKRAVLTCPTTGRRHVLVGGGRGALTSNRQALAAAGGVVRPAMGVSSQRAAEAATSQRVPEYNYAGSGGIYPYAGLPPSADGSLAYSHNNTTSTTIHNASIPADMSAISYRPNLVDYTTTMPSTKLFDAPMGSDPISRRRTML